VTADGNTNVPVSLSDCDKLIEKYAKLALDFSAADHGNEPGECSFWFKVVSLGNVKLVTGIYI